ncbi:MAG: hypothetical protein IJE44_04250 [Clostridia bacterium]|nr:hypothetical protein [Clostridia bacterium]
MNREAGDWKCPDCDTINIGRRCVICGKEKPEEKVIEKTKPIPKAKAKTTKEKIILYVCAVVLFVVVSFLAVKAIVDLNDKNNTIEVTETKGTEREEKEVFVKDSVYKNKFSISVDKVEMDKKPKYLKRTMGNATYSVPMNFENTEGDTYLAYDETAYIRFFVRKAGDKKAEELMEDAKMPFGSGVSYEKAEYSKYVFRAEVEEIRYHYCEKVQDGEAIGVVFAYPKEYADIYDSYADKLIADLKFPIDVIEIE